MNRWLLVMAALLLATTVFSADDEVAEASPKESKKKEKSESKKKSEKSEKTEKIEKPAVQAEPANGSSDDLKLRMSDTLDRMAQMDKEWKGKRAASEESSSKRSEKAKKSDSDSDDEKESKKKEKKTSDKESKRHYIDPDRAEALARDNGGRRDRVMYNGHMVEDGAWTEVGGVTRSSSASGSNGPLNHYSERSHSSSSIGVRATVIRLDGPDE